MTDLAVIAARHQPEDDGKECEWCGPPWPCDSAQLLAHIAAQDAELAALRTVRDAANVYRRNATVTNRLALGRAIMAADRSALAAADKAGE